MLFWLGAVCGVHLLRCWFAWFSRGTPEAGTAI
jgi:hypothetical protein